MSHSEASTFPLGVTTDEGERVLTINTRKPSKGGIQTRATVYHVNLCGMSHHVLMLDYCEVLAYTTRPCTAKAVMAQHAGVLSDIERIKALARAHYADKGAA